MLQYIDVHVECIIILLIIIKVRVSQVPTLRVTKVWLQGSPTTAVHSPGCGAKVLHGPERPQQTAPVYLQTCACFEAGRLHSFLHEWRKITSDPVTLAIVENCHLVGIHIVFFNDLEYRFTL